MLWHKLQGAGNTFRYTYLNFYKTDYVDQTTKTINNVNIGEAADNRYVVITVSGAASTSTSTTYTTCTINGVSATRLVHSPSGPTTYSVNAAIFIAKVDSGTSVSVTVTSDQNCRIQTINSYAFYSSSYSVSASGSARTSDRRTSDIGTLNLNKVPSLVIACGQNRNNTSSNITWSGVNIDSSYDADSTDYTSAASIITQTNPTIVFDSGGTSANVNDVCACAVALSY